jgi:hypothetical protein
VSGRLDLRESEHRLFYLAELILQEEAVTRLAARAYQLEESASPFVGMDERERGRTSVQRLGIVPRLNVIKFSPRLAALALATLFSRASLAGA